jgi:hypothetical protein
LNIKTTKSSGEKSGYYSITYPIIKNTKEALFSVSNDNFTMETIFKNEVLDWLNNG